jgi:hypothetical protein
MKRLFLLATVLTSLAACAQLPEIKPDTVSSPSETASVCGNIFPQGRWQLYHIIEATAPGGQRSSLTGVSVLSSRDRTIQWALMTVEGFVLFSGRYDGTLTTIERAIPPFDRPGFAQGLMDDLMMLFFEPHEPLFMTGRLETGGHVCRYGQPENTTDVVIKEDGTWAIYRYSSRRRLTRSILGDQITAIGSNPFAKHLILKNHSVIGYQLELKLVEAIPLDNQGR